MMRLRHRIAGQRQVGWAFIDQVIVSGMNFVTIVILARFLGVSGLGLFALAWMVVLFAGSLQGALIVSPMMSLGAQRREEQADAYFAAMWRHQLQFAWWCAVVTIAATLLWGAIASDGVVTGLAMPLALAVASYQLQDFVRRYFFVRLRPRVAFINDALSYVGQVALLLVMFKVPVDHIPLTAASVLWVIGLTSLIPTVVFSREIRRLRPRAAVQDGLFRKQWSYSKWQVGSALLYWVKGNFMMIVSGFLLGTAAVGALTAIHRIINVAHVMLQSLENVVPTQCSMRYVSGGMPAFTAYFRRTLALCVAVTTVFSLVIAAFPASWLRLLLGSEFVKYAPQLRLFAPYCVLVAIGVVLPVGLRTFHATRFIFITSTVTALLSVAITWPIVAQWGIDGAIVGMLLAQAVTDVMYVFGLRRVLSRVALEGVDPEPAPAPKVLDRGALIVPLSGDRGQSWNR